MSQSIQLKHSFILITQNNSCLKNVFIGGLLQLLLIISLIIPIYGWIVSLCLSCYFCGYYLSTIKNNIDNKEFVWTNFKEKKLLLSGAKFIGAILLLFIIFYFVLAILGIIVFTPILLIASSVGINGGGEGLGWLGVIIVMFIVCYGVYPYLFITLVASITNYINEDKIISLLAFKKIFKIFKDNWKATLKSSLTLILAPLLLIPFIGFYIGLVLSKTISNYILITKLKENTNY